MKTFSLLPFFILLLANAVALAQTPIGVGSPAAVSVNYAPSAFQNVGAMSTGQLATAFRECVVDFHFSGPSARVVMESPDGLQTYFDRLVSLEVQAFEDSTWVAGQSGNWTMGLGHYQNIGEFRVRVMNPVGPQPTVAQGTYP